MDINAQDHVTRQSHIRRAGVTKTEERAKAVNSIFVWTRIAAEDRMRVKFEEMALQSGFYCAHVVEFHNNNWEFSRQTQIWAEERFNAANNTERKKK